MTPARRLITSLIGPRGCGKTSVGARLARRLGAEFVDLDEVLTRLHSRESGQAWPGAGEILAALGEPAFRDLETRALAQVLDAAATGAGEPPGRHGPASAADSSGATGSGSHGPAAPIGSPPSSRPAAARVVLATGGGVVERAANRERLQRETDCVRLVVPAARLRQRLAADPTFRPALHPASEGSNPLDEIEAVLERREPLYKATCHFTLDGEADDIEGLAARIQAWLESSS